jgi:hypothetical protein
MEPFAAGIIPWVDSGQTLYFLLGLEKSNKKWSGFVGNCEENETKVQTAIREFNEETSKCFEKKLSFFEDCCLNQDPIEDVTVSGKKVYIWFIKCNKRLNLDDFYLNQCLLSDQNLKEKVYLKWFSLNDIKHNNNILFKLKCKILENFK